MPKLKEKIDGLPPELRREVDDFVNYLIEKYKGEKNNKLNQEWAGGLKEYKDKYTSVELQHKISQLRSER